MPGLEPSLVFDHIDFWILNKPLGWTVQRDANAPSVLAWLNEQHQATAYPVHRLDKPTSGLLIVAKHEQSNRLLSQSFAQRQIQKTYLAISDRKPKKKQGWVKGDMAQSRRSQWKLLRTMERPAITQFRSLALDDGNRGFILSPKTGKTHQLRVALKSLACPILGDTLYGGTEAARLYLHAWQLQFDYQGQMIQVCVEPDEDWQQKWATASLEHT